MYRKISFDQQKGGQGSLVSVGADHLSCLTLMDLYRYLSQEHDATTLAVLLGMGAAKAGTCP